MESVDYMYLRKILKNRKAMTPIMIGIIVAASVLAVFFIVMAVTIPYMKNDVNMEFIEGSIRGNATDDEALIFKVVCDFDNGTITNFRIYRNSVLYGSKNQTEVFEPRETRFIHIRYFDVNFGVTPPGETQNTTHLLFVDDAEYTIRMYYEDSNGIERPYTEAVFTYDRPN